MKNLWVKRIIAIALCLCLFPFAALAEASFADVAAPQGEAQAYPAAYGDESEGESDFEEEYSAEYEDEYEDEYAGEYEDEYDDEDTPAESETPPAPKPVQKTEFTLSFRLHPEAFPEGGSPSLADWAAFFGKLSLRGGLHTIDFLLPDSRVFFNGGLFINETLRLPLIYDGYNSFRYLVTPALKNESVHFQMHNFFEFMLKPYYFMDFPTQYLSLFMYPEASYYLADSYYTPTAKALAGTGNRTVSYDQLYELAETLNAIVLDDPHYLRAETFLTNLLVDINGVEIALDKLGSLDALLDALDPEQEGMTITTSGNQETYILGETTVFQKKQVGDAVSWTVTIPDPDGYLSTLSYQWTPSAEGAALKAALYLSLDGEERIRIAIEGDGFPCLGDTEARGRVAVDFGGEALPEGFSHAFVFDWHGAEQTASSSALNIHWLHPETGEPAASLMYEGTSGKGEHSIFPHVEYAQYDFFNLNDELLTDYKQRYLPTLALAAVPFVLEMPAGALNSLFVFANETGILSFMGLESEPE